MKIRGNFMAIFLSVFTAFLISCQLEKIGKEFNQAKAMLLEVSMKADSAAMVQARQRFEKLWRMRRWQKMILSRRGRIITSRLPTGKWRL
jgi:hypothetical protein